MIFETKFDALSEEELLQSVMTWINDFHPPVLSEPVLAESYNAVIPRSVFLKNVRQGGSLLDLGAGDGTLSLYRGWPLFARTDLKMYALSLDKGEMFDDYDGYEVRNFETSSDLFAGIDFDAINCAHFLEHMSQPGPAIRFIGDRLASGGRLYLEWPHPITKRMPRRQILLDHGIEISTTRFDDDSTHVEAWDMGEISGLLADQGFAIEVAGRLHLPWLASQMRDHGRTNGDSTWLTLGFWAAFGWAQYLVAYKR